MTKVESSKELPWAIPREEQQDDFEWLHHHFTTEFVTRQLAAGADLIAATDSKGRAVAVFAVSGEKTVVMAGGGGIWKSKSDVTYNSGSAPEFHAIDFRKFYEADPLEQVHIVKRGVNARMVDVLAASMQMPKEKLIVTLGLARATIQRKSSQQMLLSSDESSRVMGVSKLIGQAQAMVEESGAPESFDAATWVAQWLDQPLPALGGHRPGEFMDTAEGQAIVSQLLGRLQSGAYA